MLTTPAIASDPYTADAPSFKISIDLIIATGMVFKSTEESAPVPEETIRRPFNNTRVRCDPMPRKLTVAEPPEPLLLEAPRLIPAADG